MMGCGKLPNDDRQFMCAQTYLPTNAWMLLTPIKLSLHRREADMDAHDLITATGQKLLVAAKLHVGRSLQQPQNLICGVHIWKRRLSNAGGAIGHTNT